jgi:hypothetical protein
MTKFHAVMIDETGQGEFGVTFEAKTRAKAYDYLHENYPESRCDQLESPADTRKRERRIYEQAERAYNGEFYGDEH